MHEAGEARTAGVRVAARKGFAFTREDLRRIDEDAARFDECLRYLHANAAGPVEGVYGPGSVMWTIFRETVVLAGGGAGTIRTGRTLDVGYRRHGDLFVAIANAMGDAITHFGDASSGPLPDLLA